MIDLKVVEAKVQNEVCIHPTNRESEKDLWFNTQPIDTIIQLDRRILLPSPSFLEKLLSNITNRPLMVWNPPLSSISYNLVIPEPSSDFSFPLLPQSESLLLFIRPSIHSISFNYWTHVKPHPLQPSSTLPPPTSLNYSISLPPPKTNNSSISPPPSEEIVLFASRQHSYQLPIPSLEYHSLSPYPITLSLSLSSITNYIQSFHISRYLPQRAVTIKSCSDSQTRHPRDPLNPLDPLYLHILSSLSPIPLLSKTVDSLHSLFCR